MPHFCGCSKLPSRVKDSFAGYSRSSHLMRNTEKGKYKTMSDALSRAWEWYLFKFCLGWLQKFAWWDFRLRTYWHHFSNHKCITKVAPQVLVVLAFPLSVLMLCSWVFGDVIVGAGPSWLWLCAVRRGALPVSHGFGARSKCNSAFTSPWCQLC